MTEMQSKALKRVREVYAKAEEIYGVPLTFPIISFRLKGRRAGYAVPAHNKIAFNNDMLHQNGDAFINDTVGHEAAHLIAYSVYGYNIEPHGKEWKKVMITVCGQSPTKCSMIAITTVEFDGKNYMKKLPSALQLFKSIRKLLPPSTIKHKNKKLYNRKNKKNENDY